jgi:hypothetical protein
MNTSYSNALKLTAQLDISSENNDEFKSHKQYYPTSSNPSVLTTPVSPIFDIILSNNISSTIPSLSLSLPENKINRNNTELNKHLQNRLYLNQNPNFIVKNNQNNSSFESPINQSNNIILTPNSATSNLNCYNQNETFEQKWARIQAAKKTNPFAEDIAKKFEIKL